MSINEEKWELRKKVKALKQEYTFDQKKTLSKEVFFKIEVNPVFQKANTIMAYWSMKDEVHTHDFIQKWANAKKIILPVVYGDQLELKEFKGVNELVAGDRFGIPEPDGQIFRSPKEIELIIVPGVAFDKNGNRMGRGKAYYDKLLRTSKAYKLGVCFSFQVFESVPFDELDVQMDEVLFND
ncbi:MAG: 5-formyltetrahydrofolate cyclo-ligase [Bacteroidales bacterium]|nr:5-formyltetrahydrofolate cyclo-ligase [Bacteroidales bacterium]